MEQSLVDGGADAAVDASADTTVNATVNAATDVTADATADATTDATVNAADDAAVNATTTAGRHPLRIALVAGETSGDQLGAGLIDAIRARYPHSCFVGVGGARMAAAGCQILFDMERISVIGLDGLFAKLPDIFRIRRQLRARFTATDRRPDLFVGIDAPDFNLTLEGQLKRHNITCVHYVSPTVWAWRGYRIHKIRRAVDHILTLFPFEADYYQRHGVPVTCVGHPLADQISAPERTAARRRLGFGEGLLIALLPGSRRSEIKRLGAVFIRAARRILVQHADAQFVLPFAGPAAADEFERVVGSLGDLPVRTLDGDSRSALEACDVAVLASGTAALEAALLRRPHIVVYKLAAFSYWLMRRLRRVDYYSMPNQLLPTPMIPELIQSEASAANIAQQVDELLRDAARVADLERHFARLHQSLKRDANARAAETVLTLAGVAR